jgi:hypothetical protein
MQVRRRARFRCEYCHFPERFSELPFQIDHVIAQQHAGATDLSNLAFACLRCNSHKGPNLAGIDPASGAIVRLFNPRHDIWAKHFGWNGPRFAGLTGIGRATIEVLQINRPDALLARAALIAEGVSFGFQRRK